MIDWWLIDNCQTVRHLSVSAYIFLLWRCVSELWHELINFTIGLSMISMSLYFWCERCLYMYITNNLICMFFYLILLCFFIWLSFVILEVQDYMLTIYKYRHVFQFAVPRDIFIDKNIPAVPHYFTVYVQESYVIIRCLLHWCLVMRYSVMSQFQSTHALFPCTNFWWFATRRGIISLCITDVL